MRKNLLKGSFTASKNLTKQQGKRYNNLKNTMNKMGIKHNLKSLNKQVKSVADYNKSIQKMEFSIEKKRISELKTKDKLKGLKREYDFYKRVDKDKANKVQKQLIKERAKAEISNIKKTVKDKTLRDKQIKSVKAKENKQLELNKNIRDAIDYNKMASGSYDGIHLQNKQGLTKTIKQVKEYDDLRLEAKSKLKDQMKDLAKTDKPTYDYLKGNIPKALSKVVKTDENTLLTGKDNQGFKNLNDTETFNNNIEFYNIVNNDGFEISNYLRAERSRIAKVYTDKSFSWRMNNIKPGLSDRFYNAIVDMDMISYKQFYDRFGGKSLGEIYAEMKSMDDVEIASFVEEKISYINDLTAKTNHYYNS